MLEQRDERGDEPIHAAACNGCTGCVRVGFGIVKVVEYSINDVIDPVTIRCDGNYTERKWIDGFAVSPSGKPYGNSRDVVV